MLLEPKEVSISLRDGGEKVYLLSKFPAIAGREIVTKYPMSAMPKLGDYAVNEETMLKLMAYVAVPMPEGDPLQLRTRVLVDNHVPDWEALAKLEIAMMEYNVSFLGNGKGSTFLEAITQKAHTLILKILTDFAAQSSPPTKPP